MKKKSWIKKLWKWNFPPHPFTLYTLTERRMKCFRVKIIQHWINYASIALVARWDFPTINISTTPCHHIYNTDLEVNRTCYQSFQTHFMCIGIQIWKFSALINQHTATYAQNTDSHSICHFLRLFHKINTFTLFT